MKSPKVAELERRKKEQQAGRRRARGEGSVRGATTRGDPTATAPRTNVAVVVNDDDDRSPRPSEDESDDTRAAPAGTSARAGTAAASAPALSDGDASAHEGGGRVRRGSGPTASSTDPPAVPPRRTSEGGGTRERKPPGRYAAYETDAAMHGGPTRGGRAAGTGRRDASRSRSRTRSPGRRGGGRVAAEGAEGRGARRASNERRGGPAPYQSPPRTRGEQRRSRGAAGGPGAAGVPGRVDVDPTLRWRRVVLYGYPRETFPNNVERLFTNHLRVNQRAIERLQLIRGRRGDVTAFAQFATEGDARLVIDTLTRKADRGAPITFRDCALSASHLHDWPRNMDRPRWIPCVAAPGWTPDPRNDVRTDPEPAPPLSNNNMYDNNNNNNNRNGGGTMGLQQAGPVHVDGLGRWEKWGPRWWECHVDTRGHMGGVIGKSGATIKKLQAETGAKMRFNKEAGGAAANEVVVWSNSEHVAVAGARAVCALVADLVESAEALQQGGRGGARGRREAPPLRTRGAARKAHGSDPEDGEIHEGAVVLALGDGDDALDFTDVLPTTATEARDGRNPRDAVGKRLRVWWPGEGRYFAGVVDRWDESRKLHVVRYDDGDVEAVDLARETWDWEKADEDREGEKGRVDEPPPPPPPPPSERRGVERTPDLPRAPGPDAPRDEEPRVEPEPLARVADPNAKQFTCDACGKGPYNAKGIKLHRKMWCNKEGPFVGKKKGVETAAAPGDAKKRPRSASADRFGFVDEAGGERGELGDDRRETPEPEEPAIGPSFDAMRTQIENEFATRSQLESTLRDLDTDADATAAAKGAFVRVRLKRRNAVQSGYACEQIDRVSRYQPGLAAGVTPARDEGWEWKVHFGSGSSAVRFLSNTRPDREETFGWMVRHFVKDSAQLAGAGTKRARTK